MITEAPGWGDPGTIRHAEQIGHTVWLADHGLQERGDQVSADLEAAIANSRSARAEVAKPELCGARAVGTECVRPVHPLWELHEDWEGHTWCAGEAPR